MNIALAAAEPDPQPWPILTTGAMTYPTWRLLDLTGAQPAGQSAAMTTAVPAGHYVIRVAG